MSHRMTTINHFVRIAAAAAAIGLAASPVLAQGTQGPPSDSAHWAGHHGPHGPGRAAMLFKGITLSAAQKAQVRTLEQSFRASRDSIHKTGTRPDREQMRSFMESHLTALRGVLTPSQQFVFDNNVKQMKAHMEQHRKEHMQQGAPAPQGR